MSEPFIGEIRMFAGTFPPVGWEFCDGQSLSIAENDVLFALIGTTYGGDGQVTFSLPDLRGRIPIHAGGGFTLGEMGGSETVTLTANQMPAHTHTLQASTMAATGAVGPANNIPGASTTSMFYSDGAPSVPMSSSAVGNVGGNQAHDNMAPYTGINYIIALSGIFPSRP